jgi:hypothetical protein
MKKYFVIALVVLVASLAFAACGGKTDAAASAVATADVAAATADAAAPAAIEGITNPEALAYIEKFKGQIAKLTDVMNKAKTGDLNAANEATTISTELISLATEGQALEAKLSDSEKTAFEAYLTTLSSEFEKEMSALGESMGLSDTSK